jgi:hypothetical protein
MENCGSRTTRKRLVSTREGDSEKSEGGKNKTTSVTMLTQGNNTNEVVLDS